MRELSHSPHHLSQTQAGYGGFEIRRHPPGASPPAAFGSLGPPESCLYAPEELPAPGPAPAPAPATRDQAAALARSGDPRKKARGRLAGTRFRRLSAAAMCVTPGQLPSLASQFHPPVRIASLCGHREH